MTHWARDRRLRRRAGLAAAALAACALLGSAPASAQTTAQTVVVSQTPVAGTPDVLDGAVNAVEVVGSEVVVGGSFTQVKDPGGAILSRPGLFAFDPSTGAIDPNFAPTVNGGTVSAVAGTMDGLSVFVAGQFTSVNGTTENRLAKLTLATGALDPTFHATITGTWVESIVVKKPNLFLGGAFSAVDGAARERFAAVNLRTGAVNPNVNVSFTDKRRGTLRVAHLAINPAGTRLLATGTFTRVNGLDRSQIAMLDLTTPKVSVTTWETNRFKAACDQRFDTDIRGVDFAPDGSYFVVADTGGSASGSLCDTVSLWPANATGKGRHPTWVDSTGGDSLTQVVATGAAIYVGGHQRWMNNPFGRNAAGPGAVSRLGIAALDPVNGLPYSWNPGRNPRGSGVWALTSTADGIWVGSDTGYIDGLYHDRLAFMPVAGGETVAQPAAATLPGELVTLGAADPTTQSFDGSTLGTATPVTGSGVDWTQARGAFMLGGQLYTGWSDGTLEVRSFDGSTFGPPSTVNLNGLTAAQFPVASLTGMFYDPARGRLYYTVAGDSSLYYRYFEPESQTVGAQTFTAGTGIDWSGARGLMMANGSIYYSAPTTPGGSAYDLYQVTYTGGRPVASSRTVVATGQPTDTVGLFLLAP